MNLHIIILAAGQGKRMFSNIPKVLHSLGGKPMLTRVVETAQQLNPNTIHVIYGYQGEEIKKALPELEVHWVHQKEQLGTGHAVLQALPYINDNDLVLILSADVPLIPLHTLQDLIKGCHVEAALSGLTLLVAQVEKPKGLGRIIRDQFNRVLAIVEEKDANEQEREINEIYTGICCLSAQHLKTWLPRLKNDNAQKEYYLTEIIEMALVDSIPINTLTIEDAVLAQGVNDRLQLHQMERLWQHRQASALLERGVMIADANRFDLRGELICGKDVFIDINCSFSGKVILGDNCQIGPNCHLTEVSLGANCLVAANSILEGCLIGDLCQIGPFARLRAGTQLDSNCKIGNFVETKKAIFGAHSKANHLSYLGDVLLGQEVNIGAGTITCNYDGANKYQTIIEDGAFIGSDTQLVAPVTIGANATIGAGSTIRHNVPPNELTLTKSKQQTIFGWERPKKKEK